VIAKITRGSDPGRIGAYLHGPGRAEEHVYDQRVGGAVIAGTIPVHAVASPQEWVEEMQIAISRRADITRPVWQVSLRAAPGDRVLADAEWAHAAQGFAQRLGFDDHPWVAVRHARDHVHLVVSRVDHDGVVWHGKFDRRMAQQACVQLEAEHHLIRAPRSQAVTVAPGQRLVAHARADGQLTQGEWQRGVGTRAAPARVVLAERVHTAAALAAGRGRRGFEEELARLGVAFQANEASTGRMNGYRFADPAHRDPAGVAVWFKASQLDKSLSWAALSTRLADPPLPAVELPARRLLQTRTGRDRDLAAAQDRARGDRDRAAARDRAGAHQELHRVETRWARTWTDRSHPDRDQARVEQLRRQLHLTLQPGDHVPALTELAEAANHEHIRQILSHSPPPGSRPSRRADAEAEAEIHASRSRSYHPPGPDHDHGLGR